MTKLGTIDLYFHSVMRDGRLKYTSPYKAYELIIPLNEQTKGITGKGPTYKITMDITTYQAADTPELTGKQE